jgi:hypothetical protein
MVSRDISLLNILIHTVYNSSYSTAVYFACMLYRPAALLFMILAVISVCYTWLKGLQMVWSQLCASHGFLILIYHLAEVVFPCMYVMSCRNWGCQIVNVWKGPFLEACVIHLPQF